MSKHYREILSDLRSCFPSPLEDPTHDLYLVQSISSALLQASQLKNQTLTLRHPEALELPQNLDAQAAATAQLGEETLPLEEVIKTLVGYLDGMTIWGHPHYQRHPLPAPSIASLVGIMLAGLYNPNLVSDQASQKVALAELEVVAMVANLIGYEPKLASGVFTFGGTGTVLYGMKVGIEKALPGAMNKGVGSGAVILVSERGHYCVESCASWLGLGKDSVIKISTNNHQEIDIQALGKIARKVLSEGRKIAGMISTIGTTDHFAIDDLKSVVHLRDSLVEEFNLSYTPHVHADAVIGWAWSVFNDYFGDEEDNQDPLGFKKSTYPLYQVLAGVSKRLRYLHLADSVGVDFHKTGFTPYASSLVLFKNRLQESSSVENDLDWLRRDCHQIPYIYHFGDYHPGQYTLECSRSGAGVLAALANLKLFGLKGLQAILGYLVEMSLRLRQEFNTISYLSVVNPNNGGPVTLFRAYPNSANTLLIEQEATTPELRDFLLYYNAYNICIEQYIREKARKGSGVTISRTNEFRLTTYVDETFNQPLPVVALKSYILSPFVNEESIQLLVDNLMEARENINKIQVKSVLEEFLMQIFWGQGDEKKLASESQKILATVEAEGVTASLSNSPRQDYGSVAKTDGKE